MRSLVCAAASLTLTLAVTAYADSAPAARIATGDAAPSPAQSTSTRDSDATAETPMPRVTPRKQVSPPPSSASADSFRVQVGAFRRAANAAETQRRLESLGIPVFVEQQGALQVVNAGPYASRDDAERASLRLRNAGIENYLFGQSTAHETPAPAGRYVVQAGAFRDPANARQLAGRLRRAGELPFTIVSGRFTLVRIGPFGSLRAARAANARMQKRGLKGVVLTR